MSAAATRMTPAELQQIQSAPPEGTAEAVACAHRLRRHIDDAAGADDGDALAAAWPALRATAERHMAVAAVREDLAHAAEASAWFWMHAKDRAAAEPIFMLLKSAVERHPDEWHLVTAASATATALAHIASAENDFGSAVAFGTAINHLPLGETPAQRRERDLWYARATMTLLQRAVLADEWPNARDNAWKLRGLLLAPWVEDDLARTSTPEFARKSRHLIAALIQGYLTHSPPADYVAENGVLPETLEYSTWRASRPKTRTRRTGYGSARGGTWCRAARGSPSFT